MCALLQAYRSVRSIHGILQITHSVQKKNIQSSILDKRKQVQSIEKCQNDFQPKDMKGATLTHLQQRGKKKPSLHQSISFVGGDVDVASATRAIPSNRSPVDLEKEVCGPQSLDERGKQARREYSTYLFQVLSAIASHLNTSQIITKSFC